MHHCSQDRIYLIKNDKRGVKEEPEVPTLKIELPKKKEIPKKMNKPISTSSSSDYAYSFDQVISSSPNTAFFINSLKTRLTRY
jgi:hypothetical protein